MKPNEIRTYHFRVLSSMSVPRRMRRCLRLPISWMFSERDETGYCQIQIQIYKNTSKTKCENRERFGTEVRRERETKWH